MQFEIIRVENVAELVMELLEGKADKYDLADLGQRTKEVDGVYVGGGHSLHYLISTGKMPDGVYQTNVEVIALSGKRSKMRVFRTRDSFKAGYFHELLLTTARTRIYPNPESWLKDTKAIYKAVFQLYEAEQELKKAGVPLPLIPLYMVDPVS